MAFTGHSGMQTAQSMHSSGSITSMFGPSRKQSTGQTSTQSVYLHLMQDSVTTCVITAPGADPMVAARSIGGSYSAIVLAPAILKQVLHKLGRICLWSKPKPLAQRRNRSHVETELASLLRANGDH